MGLYHVGYAAVSKKASVDYLDRVFVDMMWYKAFSIYLVLRQGINVLFQDVDLVWFRDPMQYFHDYRRQTYNRSMETGKTLFYIILMHSSIYFIMMKCAYCLLHCDCPLLRRYLH